MLFGTGFVSPFSPLNWVLYLLFFLIQSCRFVMTVVSSLFNLSPNWVLVSLFYIFFWTHLLCCYLGLSSELAPNFAMPAELSCLLYCYWTVLLFCLHNLFLLSICYAAIPTEFVYFPFFLWTAILPYWTELNSVLWTVPLLFVMLNCLVWTELELLSFSELSFFVDSSTFVCYAELSCLTLPAALISFLSLKVQLRILIWFFCTVLKGLWLGSDEFKIVCLHNTSCISFIQFWQFG